MISWHEGNRIGDARTQGYLDAMRRANLPVRDGWIAHSSNTLEDSFGAAHRLLSGKPRLTAIVCANDVMAFGVKRYVESVGLEIGVDVALVGYDDTPVSELIGLTSVRQPIPLIATRIMDLLMAEINHTPLAERHVILDPTLVVRESSRTLRPANT
jgi:LacI family repressor for deo operon, udp, cdd, tsx, nupC, and nupG